MKTVKEFYKWVQNAEGKGEIARYEQFLLFPQCFLKTCRPTADTLRPGLVWERVNNPEKKKKLLENILEKGVNAGFNVSEAQVFRKHCGKRRNCW